MTTYPTLRIGTFGTHVFQVPTGKFKFVGTVPIELNDGRFETEEAALAAFVAFFKAQPVAWQRENVGNLRNDVFAAIFEAQGTLASDEETAEALGFESVDQMNAHAEWIENQKAINARVRQAVEDSRTNGGIIDLTFLPAGSLLAPRKELTQ